MKQLYAVKVRETVIRETVVYVRAGDRHDATDAAYAFGKGNDLPLRPVENSILAYEAHAVADGPTVDVEV